MVLLGTLQTQELKVISYITKQPKYQPRGWWLLRFSHPTMSFELKVVSMKLARLDMYKFRLSQVFRNTLLDKITEDIPKKVQLELNTQSVVHFISDALVDGYGPPAAPPKSFIRNVEFPCRILAQIVGISSVESAQPRGRTLAILWNTGLVDGDLNSASSATTHPSHEEPIRTLIA
jgi:hypothetical protein